MAKEDINDIPATRCRLSALKLVQVILELVLNECLSPGMEDSSCVLTDKDTRVACDASTRCPQVHLALLCMKQYDELVN